MMNDQSIGGKHMDMHVILAHINIVSPNPPKQVETRRRNPKVKQPPSAVIPEKIEYAEQIP